MKEIMLAVDIGTTNVKCIAFEQGMRPLGEGSGEGETLALGNSRFEQRPEDWWTHMKEAMAAAIRAAGATPSQVRQIIVSAQGPTFLPVDRDGKPLHNGLIWMDRRSDAQCDEIRALLDDRVYEITGNKTDPYYVLSELLWFRENHPDLYEKTRHALQVNGYVNFRLTGEFATDETHATLTQAYDMRRRAFSEEILGALGLEKDIFPEMRPSYERAGRVTRAASLETGIPEGTEVLMGSIDAAAAALEGGGAHTGVAVEITGTSTVLMFNSGALCTHPGLTYMHSILPEKHSLFGCMSATGASYKWFRNTLFAPDGFDAKSYGRMNEEIARDCPDPSGLLFLPYLAGERSPLWDTEARGSFYGLTLGSTRGQMMRAVMEGVAMAVYDNLLCAKKASVPVERLRCVGGHANSDLWTLIKASLFDMPIELPKANYGAIGGLMAISAWSRGEFSSIEEATDQLLKIDRVIEPKKEWTEFYREQFALYKALYENNRAVNAVLANQKIPKG